jgi:hypothetical protein
MREEGAIGLGQEHVQAARESERKAKKVKMASRYRRMAAVGEAWCGCAMAVVVAVGAERAGG